MLGLIGRWLVHHLSRLLLLLMTLLLLLLLLGRRLFTRSVGAQTLRLLLSDQLHDRTNAVLRHLNKLWLLLLLLLLSDHLLTLDELQILLLGDVPYIGFGRLLLDNRLSILRVLGKLKRHTLSKQLSLHRRRLKGLRLRLLGLGELAQQAQILGRYLRMIGERRKELALK